MLFNAVVAASGQVAATRSRLAKAAVLAETLRAADEDGEVAACLGMLTGRPAQGRLGLGWAALARVTTAPADTPGLTVTSVDAALTELARTTGGGSTRRRDELLTALFRRATEDERAHLTALIGGELRQGALEGVMVDALALATGVAVADVRRALMLCGSLAETAVTAFRGGAGALAGTRLIVGRGVRPMLATPAGSLAAAVDELGDHVIDYKMDGARVQVHRRDTAVWVFTRTLRDITESVPELVNLTLELPCESVVLDGETLALTDSGRPRAFQETMSRFGSARHELPLRPYFFDCLHLDGRDLLDEPLRTRLTALERVAGRYRVPVGTGEHALDEALAAGHEGVMVKALDSPYAAGRRGRAWQKVKPEHTLDLIVLAAEWGHGRRRGTLSNLHLGARDPDGGPPVMVGKTFKGLTDELLRWQTETLPGYAVTDRPTGAREDTVYLRPELVVEIALDGVQRSTRYPGGVALRFARVRRYRPDKSPAQADSLETVRALFTRG